MSTSPTPTHRNAGGIDYILTRKSVKNINLRVRSDGTVAVSANPRVLISRIDNFVASNASTILAAQEKFRKLPQPAHNLTTAQRKQLAEQFLPIATELTHKVRQKFLKYNLAMPEIRLRYMKSRWGSCYTTRNIIVLNSKLANYPLDCAEFVITHEFCHFIHPNHSPNFYALLDEMMPHWRQHKARLLVEKICS